jgi:hypothetical protein
MTTQIAARWERHETNVRELDALVLAYAKVATAGEPMTAQRADQASSIQVHEIDASRIVGRRRAEHQAYPLERHLIAISPTVLHPG